MATYVNQGLADTLLQHQHYLLAVEQTAVKGMLVPLKTALKEVKTKLAIMNFDPATTYTGARLVMLEQQIAGTIEAATRAGTNTLAPLLAEVIEAENVAMSGILKDALPFPIDSLITLDRLPLEAVENMIQQPLGGATLNGRLETLVKGAANDARESIATSVLLGESTYKTARRLKDMVEGGTFWKAARIARTEVARNANMVHRKVFDTHKNVLTGIQWTSTLDKATCSSCGMLDGEIFYYPPVPVGRPSVGSAPMPPLHPHCRCIFVPITKGWQSLGFTKADLKKYPGLGDMDRRSAHQMHYKDWFKNQPKDVQKKILGPGRFKKYKQGKFTFQSASQAVSKNVKPLPAASLAKLRGLASNSKPKKPLVYSS